MDGSTGKDACREALDRDGYVVLPALLDATTLARLRGLAREALDAQDAGHRERHRSQGSLVPVADHPGFADVVGHPALAGAFDALGFADPRYSSGYLIAKPPGGPPLFWHNDWWAWDDDASYAAPPGQVFAMIYLVDTTPANGCLRVVPGSHRRRHPIHDEALRRAAHDAALSRVDDPDDPLYGPAAGEVDVAVAAGDVIVGDARLLHAAHANRSGGERALLTLWFHPDHGSLPASWRARIRGFFDREGTDTDAAAGDAPTPETWPGAASLAHLFPPRVAAEPHPMVRTADPGRLAG